MEDEWYSGSSVGNEVVGSHGGAAMTTGRYGESFTPPTSHHDGTLGGAKPFGVAGPHMSYTGANASGMAAGTGAVGGAPVGGLGALGVVLPDDDDEDYDNEPPLLEELGINFEHIWSKTLAVIVPMKRIDINYLDDTDLAGPLVFCLGFGFCLLLVGKAHFGYIYGFGTFGCVATCLVLNLLGDKPIDLWKTASVLGYCLLPIIGLAAFGIVQNLNGTNLNGTMGHVVGLLMVCWCTIAATRLFEEYLDMRRQRYLVAYPVGLLYACFALITVY